MTLRTDSYSNVTSVLAFTRHLLDGQSTFNSTTRPTYTETEAFIDRASGVLNLALRGAGLTVPVTNTTAKQALADWVTQRAAEYVELTQRGVGYSDGEDSRTAAFRNLSGSANQFVKDNLLGLKRLGCAVTNKASDGLQFTALDAVDERDDPDDDDLAQPLFTIRQFDNTGEA